MQLRRRRRCRRRSPPLPSQVQAERVPPSEWRAYVRRKLVQKSEGPPPGGAEKLLRTLGRIGDSLGDEVKKLGGEMGKLGDAFGENVEKLFAGDPPEDTRGGKAGAGGGRN